MLIHYISTKQNITEALTSYFNQANYQFTRYEAAAFDSLQYLLIIEPIEMRNELFAPTPLWKSWLLERKPSVKLIFAGFASSPHPCYLNLLNLPENIAAWLDSCPAVGEFRFQDAGTEMMDGERQSAYIDPWPRQLPLTGRSIIPQMERFVDGHDHSHSLKQQITQLRAALSNIESLGHTQPKGFHEAIKEETQTVKKQWGYLCVRWEFYKDFFESGHLPINEQAGNASTVFVTLKSNFEKFTPDKAKESIEQLDNLNTGFTELVERYTNLEAYW